MTFRHASLWEFDVSWSGNFSVASFQFVKPLDTNEASPLADHLFCFGSEASMAKHAIIFFTVV